MFNSMNFDLGWFDTRLLAWALSQITLVAIVTYGVVLTMRQTAPGSRVLVCGLGLLCMSVLPSVTMWQSVGWSWGQWLPNYLDHNSISTNAAEGASEATIADLTEESLTELAWWQQVLLSSSRLLSPVDSAAQADGTKLSSPASAMGPYTSGLYLSRSPANWLALFVIGGITLGVTRLLLGIFQVSKLRRRAVGLDRTEVLGNEFHEQLEQCARQLGVERKIDLAVSPQIDTAAVVGWRRPLLLLPANWQDWSSLERRAILLHEIAHVQRADYLKTALAQAAVAINFFHPLAHALIARLRLNQELAADTLAAQTLGGSRQYVEILASLALRQPRVRTPGPAQAFLPPRRMFVRRLEMLSNMKMGGSGWSRIATFLASSAVLAVTIMASGLRPFAAVAQEADGPGGRAANSATAGKELIQLIPPSIIEGVIEIDVAKLLSLPPIAESVKRFESELQSLPVDLQSLDKLLIMMPVPGERPPLPEPLVLLRLKQGATFSAANELLAMGRPLDERTLVLGGTEELRAAIGVLRSDNFYTALLARHEQAPIRAAARMDWLQQTIEREQSNERAMQAAGSPILAFAPLWEKVDSISLGLDLNEKFLLSGSLNSPEPEDVAETLTAFKVLAKNYLTQITREQIKKGKRDPMEVMMLSSATMQATELLNSVKVTTSERQVEVTAELDAGVYSAVELFLPALLQARKAAARTQSTNNLKQLVLGLLNYESAYKRFPPAVIVDPETGIERSWRVEILPFVEQSELYAQYRKDEPWDSEANLKVLQQMPQVFALPGGEKGSETPYQAIAVDGSGLAPGRDGRGPRMAEFTDGTSNSLLLLETLPMVPWTKPVDVSDIEDARQVSVRPTEGGFLAARADGSVSFFANTLDKNTWKALITRAGGEIIRD